MTTMIQSPQPGASPGASGPAANRRVQRGAGYETSRGPQPEATASVTAGETAPSCVDCGEPLTAATTSPDAADAGLCGECSAPRCYACGVSLTGTVERESGICDPCAAEDEELARAEWLAGDDR